MSTLDLNRYCDLTPHQASALRDPAQMPPAMRAAFVRDGLITRDGRLTPDGQKALEIATAYLSGRRHPDTPLITVQDGDIRFSADRERGLYAAHLKALLALAQSPGLAWRWLCATFGSQTLWKLWHEGYILGRPVRGAPQHLTVKGLEALEAALRRAGAVYARTPLNEMEVK